MFKLAYVGALVAAFALSCRGMGPTSLPSNEAPRYRTTKVNGVDLIHAPAGAPLRPASSTTSVIGVLGGSIAADGARLSVPPGALLLPVQVAIEGKLAGRYQWRFGPNGLAFLVPATLTIAVDPAELGIDPGRLAVAVASDAGNDWQVVGGAYNPTTRTISAQVGHFSQYALCQD